MMCDGLRRFPLDRLREVATDCEKGAAETAVGHLQRDQGPCDPARRDTNDTLLSLNEAPQGGAPLCTAGHSRGRAAVGSVRCREAWRLSSLWAATIARKLLRAHQGH